MTTKKKAPEGPQERVTLKFTAGMCTPARVSVPDILKPYKPKNVVVRDKVQQDELGNMWQDVEVDCNKQAATWIEYLLLSSKRFTPNGKLYHAKNSEYAARREDMPKAWLDSGCTKAEAFAQLKNKSPTREKGKTKNKRVGKPVKTIKQLWEWL